MKCGIHQPNFFPWLGYFDKIKTSDTFVILDDVQVPKKGGSYTNRVNLNIGGKSQYFTAPIQKESLIINEIEFVKTNWRDKMIKTLQSNYGKSKNFLEYKDFIFDLVNNSENNISKYNEHAIIELCKFLNIDITKIVKSSDMNIQTTSTQRLIDIMRELDCNTYISGGGGDNYQDAQLYESNGVTLTYQNYEHPIYTQKSSEFIKGLSVLDFIFEGFENEK